jgi:hypothetical protein
MTLPAGAALGSTQDPKALIKGEPSQVDANASRLRDEATRISGLAADIEAITTTGWSGGLGEPAYAAARSAELDKWHVYSDLLEKAAAALTAYAGALRTAQSKAADAIATWDEGERATQAAVTEYNRAVDAYNAYVNRPVPVPSLGAPVTPSLGPGRPGPFVDPGQALRDEAEQILKDAREALDDAGASAVKELGGLQGSKTDSSSGPSADAKAEGPSIDWKAFEKTFGSDPGDAASDADRKGRADSPFKIKLGEVEASAKAWGAEGSWEDYWGDVKVKADGSVTVLGVEGGAEASIGEDGVVIGANGKAVLVGAEGSVGGEWGYAEAEAKGEAYVGADAEGELKLGPTGAHANGELFAGAKAEGTVSGDVGGVGGEATAEGWAGIGISGDVDVGYDDGKFTIGGSGGAALGLGGKLGGHVTIDVDEVIDTGGDIIEGIGGLIP